MDGDQLLMFVNGEKKIYIRKSSLFNIDEDIAPLTRFLMFKDDI